MKEGMLLSTDSGEYKLASFIDEQRMNRLYEKFILEYYAKECPQVTATASQVPWALDDGLGTMLPVMQSDIMLTRGNEVLIILSTTALTNLAGLSSAMNISVSIGSFS